MLSLVRATPELATQHRAGLIALLRTTVGDGAPLGFHHPLSEGDASAYWDGVIASIAAQERVLVLALEAERVIGAVQMEFAKKQNARHRAEVQKLAVLPGHRGRGIGRSLMSAIESEARSARRSLLVLDTREGQFAERFYEALGWTRSGRIPGYTRDENGSPSATIFFHKALDDVS